MSRRGGPRSPSKRFGLEYESWLFTGSAAHYAAEVLQGQGHATRIDFAFDFEVADDVYPRDLLAEFRHWIDARRLKVSHAGEEPSYTVYIGSRSSDALVRIYRRDIAQPTLRAFGLPPILRVELELKAERAAAFWESWAHDQDATFAAAAHQIERMTGWRVADSSPLPFRANPEEAEEARLLAEFVRQNGEALLLYADAGIDVLALADRTPRAPSTKFKTAARRRELSRRDLSTLVRAAECLLHAYREGGHSGPGVGAA